MNNPFSIDKSFTIRHKILEVLHTDWKENNNEYERRVGSIKIANATNISIAEIHKWQYLLVEKGEIVIADTDGQSMMSILVTGINSYIDRRYIKEGRKEKWDNIFAWARIIIPLGALLLSIVNYINNNTQSTKIKLIQEQLAKRNKK